MFSTYEILFGSPHICLIPSCLNKVFPTEVPIVALYSAFPSIFKNTSGTVYYPRPGGFHSMCEKLLSSMVEYDNELLVVVYS